MAHKHESRPGGTMKSKANIALVVFLIIGALLLVTEHWAHLTGWFPQWPYLLLLACPLMHLFMHGGHGGHGGQSDQSAPSDHSQHQAQRSEGDQQ